MSKPIVIVTGCSGRIGMAVAERFAPHFQLIGFDIIPPPSTVGSLEYMKVDLESDESVAAAFDQVKEKWGSHIVSVVHLAAYYNFTGDPSNKYETITVQGTGRLLKNLQHFTCEQFCFSSTMLVHAPCEPGTLIREESPQVGLWDYPSSKIATEKVMHEERGQIPIVVLRIAGVYDDYCNSIPLSNQIQRIYEKQFTSHVYPGDISRGTSYLHMDDLVDAIDLTVQKRAQLGEEFTVLIGEGKTASYGELQKTFEELLFGYTWKTWPIPKFIAKIGAFFLNLTGQSYIKPWMVDLGDINYELDISLAKSRLGWSPKRYVIDVAPKMIQALKKDPIRWYKHHKLTIPKWLKRSSCCGGGCCG